jgi:hypothetical protein
MKMLTSIYKKVTTLKELVADLDYRVTNIEAYNQEYFEEMEQDESSEKSEEVTPKTQNPGNNHESDRKNETIDIRERQEQIAKKMDDMQASMQRAMDAIGTFTPNDNLNNPVNQ